MNRREQTTITRYAPSPTGFQHVGGIRTALFAWLWARKNNGEFILRIEDTDKSREVDGAIQHTIDALHWLGLNYDYGPDKPHAKWGSARQSERLDVYKKHAWTLVEKGLAYPDPYTEEEVAAFREIATSEKRPFLFRHHRPETIQEWDGVQTLRFRVPKVKRYTWHDEVRGELTAGEEMLDDFILLKADGYPTYNFAHIVDDLEMNVTHVMRGEEFISSTPKFLSLYDALEIPWPIFVTLPPILGPDGKKKLSKRDGAKDLFEYKREGYLPSAMCNFLALIGWNPGEERELFFTHQDLVDAFTIKKIQRSGGAFNEEKLMWMNKEHIGHSLNQEEKFNYVAEALPQLNSEKLKKFTSTILERTHNQAEIRALAETGEYEWFKSVPNYDASMLKWKQAESEQAALPHLQKVQSLLSDTDFTDVEALRNVLMPYAEEVGKGDVLWPLRVSLSGKERSPDPFTLAYVLGKDETLTRIALACDKIS